MNTDRLVDLLSADLEPVSPGQLGKMLMVAMVTGGAAAFVLMLATFGPRPGLQSTAHLEWVVVKLLFALGVVGAAPSVRIGSTPLIPVTASYATIRPDPILNERPRE